MSVGLSAYAGARSHPQAFNTGLGSVSLLLRCLSVVSGTSRLLPAGKDKPTAALRCQGLTIRFPDEDMDVYFAHIMASARLFRWSFRKSEMYAMQATGLSFHRSQALFQW